MYVSEVTPLFLSFTAEGFISDATMEIVLPDKLDRGIESPKLHV